MLKEKLASTPATLYSTPSIVRYFDHIQNLPAVRSTESALPLVPLDSLIDAAPKVERKAVEPKKKEKKEPAAKPAEAAAANSSSTTEPAKESKKEKKEKPKKEAAAAGAEKPKKGGAQPAAAAAAADSGEPSPAMIDLRVGKIVDGELDTAPTSSRGLMPLVSLQSRSILTLMDYMSRCADVDEIES